MILEIDQSKSIVENPRKDAPAYHKNMTEKMVKIYPQELWQTIELDTMAMISYLFYSDKMIQLLALLMTTTCHMELIIWQRCSYATIKNNGG